MAKEGITASDGKDSQGSKGVGNGPEKDVDSDQLHECQKVFVRHTPSRKGKEKVGVLRVSVGISIFDTSVPETSIDPMSDLNLRVRRG